MCQSERLDQDISGIVATNCDHSFQCSCVSMWVSSSCPVRNNLFNQCSLTITSSSVKVIDSSFDFDTALLTIGTTRLVIVLLLCSLLTLNSLPYDYL